MNFSKELIGTRFSKNNVTRPGELIQALSDKNKTLSNLMRQNF